MQETEVFSSLPMLEHATLLTTNVAGSMPLETLEFADSEAAEQPTPDEGISQSAADFPIWGESEALQSKADSLYGNYIISTT
jgi:hypothetical protein